MRGKGRGMWGSTMEDEPGFWEEKCGTRREVREEKEVRKCGTRHKQSNNGWGGK